jgi:hypothetical protein
MSITALILTHTVTRHDELAAEHGAQTIDQSLFLTAARIIAGEYEKK